MKIVTIQQALRHVSLNPELDTNNLLEVPTHELISRTLFEIANGAQLGNTRAMSRANAARAMILNRLVGKRHTGSHPATEKRVQLKFIDLAGEVEK